jgi:NTE family protein
MTWPLRQSGFVRPTSRKTASLLLILLVVGLALLAWWTAADFGKVHVYRGDAPPRPAPLARPVSVALVLGGGGPRGFAHVGVLKALEREGIKPDLIVGSSMGAMIGVLYAAHPDAALEQLIVDSELAWSWRDLTLTTRPWLKGDQIEQVLRRQLAARRLESLSMPVMVVATSVENGEPAAFSAGEAVTAVRASTAVPGAFKRVGIAGREYFDGDVTAPIPIRIARESGARIVIAVDVMCHPGEMLSELRDYPDLILSDYYRHAINLRELPLADAVIAPRLGFYAGFSLEERRRFMQIGENAAQEAVPKLKQLLKSDAK